MDNKDYSEALHYLCEQVKYLNINGFPGLSGNFAEIKYPGKFASVNHGRSNTSESRNLINEELIIQLPFAGVNFGLKILFNLQEPWVPPDIIFFDEDFMSHLNVDILEIHVPCLLNWRYKKSETIAQLLYELYKLYKRYQLGRLEEEEEVLYSEYQILTKNFGISEDDIEVMAGSPISDGPSILIRLPININGIPPVLMQKNTSSNEALLQIDLKRVSHINSSFVPGLYLSPCIEALIGGSKTLGLPTAPPDTSLLDYVATIYELLQRKVKISVKCFEARKQFVAQVLCHYGGAVVEYDASKFTKVSLLLDFKEFHFLAVILLPHAFPYDSLSVHLKSLYHICNGFPFTKELPKLCYSSKSTLEEIVKELHQALRMYAPTFQNLSIKETDSH